MSRRLLACLVLLCGAGTFAGCRSYSAWLKEVIAAQPHLADRHEAPHRVAILNTGRDAFLWRIERIRGARKTIKIQTFILDQSRTTRLLMDELVAAARRGVKVSFLADALFSSHNLLSVARVVAAHENFTLRIYNPPSDALVDDALSELGILLTEFERFNQRMHNKLMVFDGYWGICGGRNYQDHYYDEDYRLNYRDRDVTVYGPVVVDMEKSFDTYWAHPASIPVEMLKDVDAAISKLPDTEKGWPFSREWLEITEIGIRVDKRLAGGGISDNLNWHEVTKIAFWADTPGKPPIDDNPKGVAIRLVGAVWSAEKEVLIQSPYLVLTNRAIELLEALHERGVKFRVHTNSLASTDSWPSYAHALRQRREMLKGIGMEIFELKPYPAHLSQIIPGYADLKRRSAAARIVVDGSGGKRPKFEPTLSDKDPLLSLHAKSMVIDGELAVIGSYNLDPRSAELNSEVLLVIWDRLVAAELGAAIETDAAPANSWVVAPRERGLARWVIVELFEHVNSVVKKTTTLDLWPIEWTTLYDLRPGHDPVDRFDPDFYDHFDDVDSFPEVDEATKRILVRLCRTLTGFIRPIM